MKISIIGVGRMGGALALALAKKGYSIANLVARRTETAAKIAAAINPKPQILNSPEGEKLSESEILFICTQDHEIEKTAAAVAGKLTSKPFVFHVSGSLSSAVLQPLKDAGCPIGSLHPLVSVSDAFFGAERFEGVYFCAEGDSESVSVAEKIVLDLKGKPFTIPTERKALYHAAAVTASGHLTALVSVAIEMLGACGIENEAAGKILLPLVKSSIANLEKQSPAEALTGTFARADLDTMRRHLEILRVSVAPELLAVYLQLGLRSTHLAEMQSGADKNNLELMREVLRAENKILRADR